MGLLRSRANPRFLRESPLPDQWGNALAASGCVGVAEHCPAWPGKECMGPQLHWFRILSCLLLLAVGSVGFGHLAERQAAETFDIDDSAIAELNTPVRDASFDAIPTMLPESQQTTGDKSGGPPKMAVRPSESIAADPVLLPVDDPTAMQVRMRQIVEFLASDELAGRGLGTEGLAKAAEYIAKQMTNIGLRTNLYDGTPFQRFRQEQTLASDSFEAHFVGSDEKKIGLSFGQQFVPLHYSEPKTIDAPVVFAGYGIVAPEHNHDDYAGLDVAGKAVIILRGEPAWWNTSDQRSDAGSLVSKIDAASSRDAAAVLFCTDRAAVRKNLLEQSTDWKVAIEELVAAKREFDALKEPSLEQFEQHRIQVAELVRKIDLLGEELASRADPLVDFELRGPLGAGVKSLPVVHIRRALVSSLLESAGQPSLDIIERNWAEKPFQSFELAGWKLAGQLSVKWTNQELANVIGLLPGEGPHSDEAIVFAAHYDHLGLGGFGSLDIGVDKDVHNGADDNASGVAVLLEVARQMIARRKPIGRSIVFVAFTGEESGMLGSKHYARFPLIPIDKTVAMLNLDMVGRIREDRLTVFGVGESPEFPELLEPLAARQQLQLRMRNEVSGMSDDAVFKDRGIPAMHFFSGYHPDYHRPTDDVEKLNLDGMRSVANLAVDLLIELADAPDRPQPAK